MAEGGEKEKDKSQPQGLRFVFVFFLRHIQRRPEKFRDECLGEMPPSM